MLREIVIGLILFACASARPRNRTSHETPTEDEDKPGSSNRKICQTGNSPIPIEVFQAHVSWECFRRVYGQAKGPPFFVCAETIDHVQYHIPCFKSGGKMMAFQLKEEETAHEILRRFPDRDLNDMVQCYMKLMSSCEGPEGWWMMVNGSHFQSPENEHESLCGTMAQSKFHIAILGISMVLGIPILVVYVYCAWMSRKPALIHCRNIIVVLFFRTLFTLLIETEVMTQVIDMEVMENWAGCEALAALESIFLNLVTAFWLILALYLYELCSKGSEKKQDISRASYFIAGLALALAIVWIIVMAVRGYPKCWLENNSLQWINYSLRFVYILIQMVLVSAAVYHLLTNPKRICDEGDRILRKLTFLTLALSPWFLVHFSLSAGRPTDRAAEDAYLFTDHFFDGIQFGLVSTMYLFLGGLWRVLLDEWGLTESKRCTCVGETLPKWDTRRNPSDAGIQPYAKGEGASPERDVTYSSVLTPERFEKTIAMYNRLNVIPAQDEARKGDPKHGDNTSIKSVYYEVEDTSVGVNDEPEKVAHVGAASSERVTANGGNEDHTPHARPHPYESKYLVKDPDSSDDGDDEAEQNKFEDEVTGERVEGHATTGETPPREGDEDVETRMRDCRRELQNHLENALRKKNPTAKERAIRRTLSGGILSDREVPGLLRVDLDLADEDAIRTGSADESTSTSAPKELLRPSSAPPSASDSPGAEEDRKPESEAVAEDVASIEGDRPPRAHRLPSIYDDLKSIQRTPTKLKGPKDRNRNDQWVNYKKRLLSDRKKMKRFQEPERGTSRQVSALLSPDCVADRLAPGNLANSKFSRFNTHTLNKIDGKAPAKDEDDDDDDDWAPQRVHFADAQVVT